MDAAPYAIDAVQDGEPITTWLIDDPGLLKQGEHSVGVQCLIGVSLAGAIGSEQIVVDFEL